LENMDEIVWTLLYSLSNNRSQKKTFWKRLLQFRMEQLSNKIKKHIYK
jgi:hypothetical protein